MCLVLLARRRVNPQTPHPRVQTPHPHPSSVPTCLPAAPSGPSAAPKADPRGISLTNLASWTPGQMLPLEETNSLAAAAAARKSAHLRPLSALHARKKSLQSATGGKAQSVWARSKALQPVIYPPVPGLPRRPESAQSAPANHALSERLSSSCEIAPSPSLAGARAGALRRPGTAAPCRAAGKAPPPVGVRWGNSVSVEGGDGCRDEPAGPRVQLRQRPGTAAAARQPPADARAAADRERRDDWDDLGGPDADEAVVETQLQHLLKRPGTAAAAQKPPADESGDERREVPADSPVQLRQRPGTAAASRKPPAADRERRDDWDDLGGPDAEEVVVETQLSHLLQRPGTAGTSRAAASPPGSLWAGLGGPAAAADVRSGDGDSNGATDDGGDSWSDDEDDGFAPLAPVRQSNRPATAAARRPPTAPARCTPSPAVAATGHVGREPHREEAAAAPAPAPSPVQLPGIQASHKRPGTAAKRPPAAASPVAADGRAPAASRPQTASSNRPRSSGFRPPVFRSTSGEWLQAEALAEAWEAALQIQAAFRGHACRQRRGAQGPHAANKPPPPPLTPA